MGGGPVGQVLLCWSANLSQSYNSKHMKQAHHPSIWQVMCSPAESSKTAVKLLLMSIVFKAAHDGLLRQ